MAKGTLTVADALGVHHRLAGDSARIVSLVPSITELLFDLGLDSRVVGRTRYCLHPDQRAQQVPVVGGTKQLDLPALQRSKATHAIVNVDENTREMAAQIRAMGIRLVATHPQAPEDNPGLYRLLGRLFDCERRSEALCSEFEAELVRVRAEAAGLRRRRVLYLIWRNPWMTVSSSTYIARTLALVNWQTVGDRGDDRYPEVPEPCALLEQADLVLFSSEPFPFKAKHMEEFRSLCPQAGAEFSGIDAEMVSWYGSRAIAGLDYLLNLARRLSGPTPVSPRQPGITQS